MIGGELDNGDIIARDYIPIDINTKITEVYDKCEVRIPLLFLEAINSLEKDKNYFLEKQSKDPKDALRCYPRTPEDGEICWKDSAIKILRLINASNKPYAGAYCNLLGEKMILWDACLVDDFEVYVAVPGQVTNVEQTHIDIACGEGKLRILKAEMNGEVNSPSFWVKSIRTRLK